MKEKVCTARCGVNIMLILLQIVICLLFIKYFSYSQSEDGTFIVICCMFLLVLASLGYVVIKTLLYEVKFDGEKIVYRKFITKKTILIEEVEDYTFNESYFAKGNCNGRLELVSQKDKLYINRYYQNGDAMIFAILETLDAQNGKGNNNSYLPKQERVWKEEKPFFYGVMIFLSVAISIIIGGVCILGAFCISIRKTEFHSNLLGGMGVILSLSGAVPLSIATGLRLIKIINKYPSYGLEKKNIIIGVIMVLIGWLVVTLA